jgi:hypothetical protein
MRSERGAKLSTTGKASNGAGQELHKRARQGAAPCFHCHEAFTIMQAIDFQGFFHA